MPHWTKHRKVIPTGNVFDFAGNRRPPLGVAPKFIWQEQRMLELSRAIHDYIAIGNYAICKEWSEELTELLKQKAIDDANKRNSRVS